MPDVRGPDDVTFDVRQGDPTKHSQWKGADVSEKGGRKRARRWYPSEPCEECGAAPVDRHHVDGDTRNNAPENIRMLCRRCHMQEDGRLAALAALGRARARELVEAAAAAQRARTTCKHGHPLVGENLYVMPQGGRACVTCRNEASRRYRARKSA